MEANTQTYKKRTRVNFSVSTKGVITPDVTLEMLDYPQEQVIEAAVDLLDKALAEAKRRSAQ